MATERPVVMHVIHMLGTGGLENGLVNIINRMDPKRFDHHIVCLTHATDFAARITNPSVRVHELHKREGHDFRVYWRYLRLLIRYRPDIVHTRNFGTLEMQFLGIWRRETKRVHGEHGRDMFDLHGRNESYNRFRRFMSRFIDRYITVSRDLREWLVSHVGIAPAKVVQIYNGVDARRFVPLDEKKRILFPAHFRASDVVLIGAVGRLAEVKNQAFLLRAFASYCERRPSARSHAGLVLVGDGPLRSMLETLADTLGIADRCWFAGDRSDVDQLLPELDLFVLPSLNEGISNTVLEAMSSGLPVIATRVGGNPELVDEGATGYLVDVNDENALVERMDRLLGDRSLRRRMGQAGRRKIEADFNWDNTVGEYAAVYDALLATRGQG